jgi:putative capsular polysaccharide synthesis protein
MSSRAARVRRVLKRAVQCTAYQTYPTAKIYYHLVLRVLYPRRETPILVYQMGKVGSETVARSLANAGLSVAVFHIHYLTAAALEVVEQRIKNHWNPSRGGRAVNLWESQCIMKWLRTGRPGERWSVVTLVRDPVARNISDYFHKLAELNPARVAGEASDELVAELGREFLERFEDHEVPLTWFDSELKSVFGLDVYDAPFPVAKGYGLYANDNAAVLVVRAEDLDRVAADAFREFLGIEKLTLSAANLAQQKPYARLYRRFIEQVELPSEYLSRMYESRFARHFYAEEELAAFSRKWRSSRESS